MTLVLHEFLLSAKNYVKNVLIAKMKHILTLVALKLQTLITSLSNLMPRQLNIMLEFEQKSRVILSSWDFFKVVISALS